MAIVKTNDLLREKFSKDMISKIQKVGELVVALQEENESIEWNKITTKEEYIKCTSILRSYNQSMADLNIVFPWDADNSFCLPYLTDFKTVDFVEFEWNCYWILLNFHGFGGIFVDLVECWLISVWILLNFNGFG